MTKPIFKLFRPSGSPIISAFFDPLRRYPIPAVALNTQGGKNWRFLTEIAVYLGNGMR